MRFVMRYLHSTLVEQQDVEDICNQVGRHKVFVQTEFRDSDPDGTTTTLPSPPHPLPYPTHTTRTLA
jgi:hypothetical protein